MLQKKRSTRDIQKYFLTYLTRSYKIGEKRIPLLHVGTRQHRLRIRQTFNFLSPCFLAHVRILNQEIARGVEAVDEFVELEQSISGGGVLSLGVLNLLVPLSPGGLLLGDGLSTLSTGLLTGCHKVLVVLLGHLLVVLGIGVVGLQLFDHLVHESHDTVALA